MATTDAQPYSYHRQLALLNKAYACLKEARVHIDRAFSNECAQLGPDEATKGEYGALDVELDDVVGSVEDVISAVEPLAAQTPPDPVDPALVAALTGDYSQDQRFCHMLDDFFDLVAEYGYSPADVLRSMAAAVAQGDQR